MLLQMAKFCSFIWLSSIPLYVHTLWDSTFLMSHFHTPFGGQNDGPKDAYTLIPKTYEYVTLHGKGDFADGIKVMEFETGRLS